MAASVPELEKRTRSTAGIRRQIVSAARPSRSWASETSEPRSAMVRMTASPTARGRWPRISGPWPIT